MARRTALARTRRPRLGAVAAAALLPALLAGCGDDGPGSAPDQRGDRAPDPARVSTPAPLVEGGEDPEVTVPLPGPSITTDPGGEVGQAEGNELSEETGTDVSGQEDGNGTSG